MLSIIQFHAGSYQPRSLQVGAGDRSLLRMSPRVERRALQRKGLVSEEALFWNCPQDPTEELTMSQQPDPFGLCALYGRLLVCCLSQAAGGWKQPSASRMGFSSEGGVAFPWSGLSTLPRGPPGQRLRVWGGIEWLAHERAGEVSLHGPQGAGLGEERDLHLISCK